jgi:excisionase family DNA binding protein
MPLARSKSHPGPKKNSLPAASAAVPDEVLTLAEAAAYLRTSPEEVLRLVREQGLPGRRVGDDSRFLKGAIQDWLRTPPSLSKQVFWQGHFGALKGDPYLEEFLGAVYRERGRPEVEE